MMVSPGTPGGNGNTHPVPMSSERPKKHEPASTGTPAVMSPTPMPTEAGDFQPQNGKDAQKLNAQFATLTPTPAALVSYHPSRLLTVADFCTEDSLSVLTESSPSLSTVHR